MYDIYLLTDYKGHFGSKWKSRPYRSGFDKENLSKALAAYGYNANYAPMTSVSVGGANWNRRIVLFTSNEEIGNNYKSYIEDTIYALEQQGAILLPRAAFLRAHNNKVFMELMRNGLLGQALTGLKSLSFGTFEEFQAALGMGEIPFPCVMKPACGAMSRGVVCAHSEREAIRNAKHLSRTPHRAFEVRDFLRSMKNSYRGYQRESRYQHKFIVQPMIKGLDADWKVLVYGNQYYPLKRHVPEGDFRASGSHCNYLAGRASEIPLDALDMVAEVYNKLDVPHLSVDVAHDGARGYLLEFQSLYFGTSTQAEFCNEYLTKSNGRWTFYSKTMDQEEVFAWGLAHYIDRHPELKA